MGPLLSCKASQDEPYALGSQSRPPPTSFWSVKDSVGAGRALPFPVDHADVQRVVAEGLQPRQHAVSLAALESEDLFLKVASVSLRRTLCLPVVNLKEHGQKSGTGKGANEIPPAHEIQVLCLCPRKCRWCILEEDSWQN